MSDVFFTDWAFPISATGAVPRTMPDRHADVISVMDFGADNLGQDDCQPAFVAAIAAATETWSGAGTKACGTVYVPRGQYKLNSAVPLLPGGPGTLNSFRIMGETAGATKIVGNFNGYLFDAGEDGYGEGGYAISGLEMNNQNGTQFTSGCIRIGGIAPCIYECIIGGMVGINLQGAKAARVSDCYFGAGGSVAYGGDHGEGSIGINFACEGGVVQNASSQNVEIVVAMSGTGLVVQSCHCENVRRLIVTGYQSPGEEIGYGYARGVVVQGISAESCGIMCDLAGPTVGSFSGIGGQMHGETGINPSPDGLDPDLPFCAIRIAEGAAESVSFNAVGGSSSGTVDPDGGIILVGMPPEGMIRTGGCVFQKSGGAVGSDTPPAWAFPGTAGGGSAVAGAANSARLINCDTAPIWSYDDLPWGTLTSATITSSTALTYSAATRLTLEVGAVLSGAGVTPGTKVTEILTSTSATVDRAQAVGSTTMIFYCNNPDDEYQIGDSVDPAWTGSVSNAGKPITVGGGDERVTVTFKETVGYVIIG